MSARILGPDHSPSKLDFGAVWDGESSTRTLSFRAIAAGTISASVPNAPYRIKGLRIMGVGASSGGASSGGASTIANMGAVGSSLVRNVRVNQTAPPWNVNAQNGEDVQIDVVFEPKFDLFNMAAGAKPSALAVKGPGAPAGWSMHVPMDGMFYGKRFGVIMLATQAEIPVISSDKEVAIPLRLFGTDKPVSGLLRSKTLPQGASLPAKSIALGANQTLDVAMSLWNSGVPTDGVSKPLEITFDYGSGSSNAATSIVGLPSSLSRQTSSRSDCGVQNAHFLMTFNVKPDRSGVEGHTQMTIFNSDMLAARIVWGVWAINGDWIWYDNAETEIGNSKMDQTRSTLPGTMTLAKYAEVVRGPFMVGCQGSDRFGMPTNVNPKWEQAK